MRDIEGAPNKESAISFSRIALIVEDCYLTKAPLNNDLPFQLYNI